MFNEVYKNKRILITGHTGFKGSWLTTWLINLGAEVAGYSIGIPSNPSHFEELKLEEKIRHYLGDIRDYAAFLKVCNEFQPEFIFHLAAQPLVRESYEFPRETFEVNMVGTLNVIEAIKELKDTVKVGVIITSDKAYDNVEWVYGYREDDKLGGEDPYSGSKGAAELVTKSYMYSFFKNGFPHIATTRAGNVIGGGDWAKDRIVPDIVRNWSENHPVDVRSPYSTRPWQHVLEPLSGYLNLGARLYEEDSSFKNQAFNFGPDSKVNKTVGALLDYMKDLWKGSPGWVNKFVNDGKKEANLLKLNCDKANINLEWYPVLTFEETMDFTVSWYYRFYHEGGSTYEYTIRQINTYTNLAKERQIKWANHG